MISTLVSQVIISKRSCDDEKGLKTSNMTSAARSMADCLYTAAHAMRLGPECRIIPLMRVPLRTRNCFNFEPANLESKMDVREEDDHEAFGPGMCRRMWSCVG
jgi:hypothetical protein